MMIKLKFTLRVAVLTALLALPSGLPAATLVWTNTSGGLWSTAANWLPNAVPSAADTAAITNAGTYTVTNTGTVTVTGLELGDTNTAGTRTLALTAGTLTVTNAFSEANSVFLLNGGTLVTAGSATLRGVLNQNSGTWQLRSSATLSTYNLTNGELRGGTLTVTNFNWVAGSLNSDVNGDKTIIPAGGVFNLIGATARHMSYYGSQGRGLDNYGTWNWTGDCILYGRNGGIVNNYGTVNVTGAANAQYAYSSGDALAPVWNNFGPFTKSVGGGIFYFNTVYLNNSSAISASSGTLSLYGAVVNNVGSLGSTGAKLQFYNASATNSGPVSVGGGTLLTVDAGGTVVFQPESLLTVPGVNAWQVTAGTMLLRTTNVTAPSVWISGGTLWHQTNNTVPVVNEDAGTWRLSVNTTVGNYNLTNGELRGGTLTVTNFNWIAGSLNSDVNGDKTIIPAGGVFNLIGATARYMSYYGSQGRGLDNYGTWNWSGDCILYGRNGGIVNNYGTVNVTGAANAQYAYVGGDAVAPVWNNYGPFTKSVGSGIFYFNTVYLNNSSAISASSGTLSLYGAVVNNVGSLGSTGAKLQFYNATMTNSGPVSVGPGTLLTMDAGGTVVMQPAASLVVPSANAWQMNAGTMQLQTTNVSAPSVWISGGTLWHQTNNTLPVVNEDAGTWRLSVNTTVGNYNLTNGELRGGTLTVTNFNWIAGNLNSDVNGDKTIIPAGGVFNLIGTATRYMSYYVSQGRGLDNYGTWNWTGDCVLYGRNGSIVNNYGVANILNTGTAQYAYYSPDATAPVWNNYGTFTKSPGTGIFYFSTVYVNNSGLLDIQSGRLAIYNAILTNSATLNLSGAATLTFDIGNSSTFLPGSTLISPGVNKVILNAATVYLQTTNVTSPSFWISGGTLYQQTNNVVPTINQDAGTWRLGLATTVGTYNLTNGELRGGTLMVTNFNWTAGNLNADANGDRTIIPAGGTFNLLGTATRYCSYYSPAARGRDLDNYGTLNWTGDCVFYGRNGSVVNNYGVANILNAGTAQYAYYSPDATAPVWNNFGTFTKSPGVGLFYFNSVYVNNSGLLDIQSGRLAIYNAILTNSATVNLSAAATLTFDIGNSSTFLPGSTLNSPGANRVIFNAATVYLQSTNVASPSFWISGGTLYQQTNNMVPVINQDAGTWRLGLATTVGNYNLTNGELRGGTLTATNFNWQNGNLMADANGDRVIIPNGGVLNLSGTATRYLSYYSPATRGRDLDNYGTLNWTGDCVVYGRNGNIVNNYGTANLLHSGTAQYAYYSPDAVAPVWNNAGTFTKSPGAGIFYFSSTYVNNSGLLDIQSGRLAIYNAILTNSATVNLSAAATLTFDIGNSSTFLPGSTLISPGANRVAFNAGTVYLQTTNVVSPSFWISGGTLYQQTNNMVPAINQDAGTWRLGLATTVGSYNLTNGELRGGTLTATNFNWQNGNLMADANGDRIIIPNGGVLNLSGTATRYLSFYSPATRGRDLDNYGTWNWTGDCTLYGRYGSTVSNYGTVNALNNGSAYYAYYSPDPVLPVWWNLGSFNKSGSNTFGFLTANVTNSGTFSSTRGITRLGGAYVQTAGTTSLGTNFIADSTVRVEAGSFNGRGSIAGALYNAGALSPGASPGLITAASYTNAPGGQYVIELGGLIAGTNYDQIRVSGTATLTGLVQVAFANGFTPVVGNSFTVMTYTARSGAFEGIQAPIGYTFQPVYTSTNFILNAVDFSNVPPVITLHPSNRTVFAGTTVRFDVAATGTDPLSYQWRFKGNPISDATNTFYILSSAQNTNAGNYSVDVANLGGFAYSSNALLSILPGFKIDPPFALSVNLPWNNVFFVNSRVGYLAGPGGTLLYTSNGGTTWTSIGPGVPNDLYAVRVIDGAIFVFGSGGHICVSYDGGLKWRLFNTGTTETFRSAYFTDINHGWAVGSGGTIYYYNTGVWTPMPSGSGADFYGVWASGNGVWAVGSGGTICRWNGYWYCSSYGAFTFRGVSFWDSLNGLAVGSGGAIYLTADGGGTWTPVSGGTGADLNSVTLATYGGVRYAWIGGAGGTLLFSGNGGGSWSAIGTGGGVGGITSLVFTDGYGVYATDGGQCQHFSFAQIPVNLPPAVAMLNGDMMVTNLASGRITNLFCLAVKVQAVAADPDGSVTNLTFSVAANSGTNFFGARTYPRLPGTYTFYWTNDFPGEFKITATAQDNLGAVATAEPLTMQTVAGSLRQLIVGSFTPDGACKLCMNGLPDKSYEVLATTELESTNWNSIGFMQLTNSIWRYFDTAATNYPYRFYRARQSP